MASIPPLRAASGCSVCRLSALRLFVGASQPGRTSFLRPVLSRQPAAALSLRHTAPLRKAPSIVEYREEKEREQEEENRIVENGPENKNQPDAEPWYLQVEAPKHPTLLGSLSPPPEAPEGSPQIVGDLAKFAADDLGLEGLSLMDLRDLDPPPALGPGLVMLFGTARSERHLHVSADRLVRWLRGRGITADADGLLGRNELKIKLRRKARKAKLLGNAPGRGRDAADDGVSTGWVCVNLGTIGWSEAEAEIVAEDGRVSGFGSPRTGTTVVVQMFVESRRDELGLEAFWAKLAERSSKRQEAIFGDGAGSQTGHSQKHHSTQQPSSDPFHILTQRRLFSTAAKRRSAAPTEDALAEKVRAALADPTAVATLSDALADDDASQKTRLLEQMKAYLSSLPASAAVQALRRGELSGEGKPSAFLRLFERATRGVSASQSWGARLWLHAAARRLGLMEYGLEQTAELVRELRRSGIDASREQLTDLARCVFAQRSAGGDGEREQAALAMRVVDTMHERGLEVVSNDVLVALLGSLVRSGADGAEARRVRANLEFLLLGQAGAAAGLACPGEAQLLELLDAYASRGEWEGFWRAWRLPPRFETPRSPRLYAYLYRRVADTHDQSLCVAAVRRCYHEMLHEDPPVEPRGAVLDALRDCVRRADPQAEAVARDLVVKDRDSERLANSEFVKLWRSLGE